jgi:hypothetical protein
MITTRITTYKDITCDLCGGDTKEDLLAEIVVYKGEEDDPFLSFVICETCLAHIQEFLEEFKE